MLVDVASADAAAVAAASAEPQAPAIAVAAASAEPEAPAAVAAITGASAAAVGANDAGADAGAAAANDAPLQNAAAGAAAANEPLKDEAPGKRGAEMINQMSRQEYKTKWMKYVRSLETCERRQSYADKVPESLSLKILDSAASKKYWFTIWLENNQKWNEVEASEEFRKTITNMDETVEAWMTEAQWAAHYKSEKIAFQIKEKQRKGGCYVTWKPDPNVPDCTDAILYKGTKRQEQKNEVAKTMSQAIKFKSEVDAVAASQLAEHLVSQECAGSRIKLDLSPLRRSLEAPPSPGHLSPAEAARRDKETQEKLKQEAAAKVKAERKQKADAKKEKEKADKAAHAASPQGQAETWLKNVVKDIHALNTAKARLESTDVLQGVKNEWVKQLDKHHAVLVEIRIRMEAVRTLTEQPTANLFVDGRQKVQAFKDDLKDLNSLLTIRERARTQRKVGGA